MAKILTTQRITLRLLPHEQFRYVDAYDEAEVNIQVQRVEINGASVQFIGPRYRKDGGLSERGDTVIYADLENLPAGLQLDLLRYLLAGHENS